ncbi:MAG: deoxyribose-phosphate aldolase [Patescibacteria group bacterium]
MKFDRALIESIRINRSAVEARAATLGTRRSFKKEAQVAAYLRAIQCLDLTTLAGGDTAGSVEGLCAKALNPVELETLEMLGIRDIKITVGAVCVYHELLKTAKTVLKGRIPVAVVATGFAAGQNSLPSRWQDLRDSVKNGADEVDVVISRRLALEGKWEAVYRELYEFKNECGDKIKMKTILGVGDLKTLDNVAKAAAVAIMAGSDFIKTSTGFEPTNATPETGLVMARQIRRFLELSGGKDEVGFKAAGGIRTAKDAMLWLTLMLEELGEEWTKPKLFRIGASSLLTDLERQLYHLATGQYSDSHSHPMG